MLLNKIVKANFNFMYQLVYTDLNRWINESIFIPTSLLLKVDDLRLRETELADTIEADGVLLGVK